jgi:hypothetical protein
MNRYSWITENKYSKHLVVIKKFRQFDFHHAIQHKGEFPMRKILAAATAIGLLALPLQASAQTTQPAPKTETTKPAGSAVKPTAGEKKEAAKPMAGMAKKHAAKRHHHKRFAKHHGKRFAKHHRGHNHAYGYRSAKWHGHRHHHHRHHCS